MTWTGSITMRPTTFLTLCIGAAAIAAAAPSTAGAPGSPPGGSNPIKVFSCRFLSSGAAQMVLERSASGGWNLVLIEQKPAMRRVLTEPRAHYSGFAHGGSAIIESRADGALIRLFVAEGGVEESFGALSETTHAGGTTRFCRPETIETRSTVEGGPHELPLSLYGLGERHIAGDLRRAPEWPEQP
jgi:hypothetical protein